MKSPLLRRDLLRVAGGAALSAAVPRVVCGQQPQPRTYIYKKAGGLEIKADVYRPDDEVERPIVVWIHGGALIMGSRRWVSERMNTMLLGAGYVVVSIDYRLAPESKLPVVIEDVEDAFGWIRREGAAQFHGDAGRMAVMGGSAGGYLTLVTGYRVEPRPLALVALWGYGDLIGDWYSTPSHYPRHQEIKMSSEEAHRQVSGPPISDDRDRQGNGSAFYQHCRQLGIWPREVSGWDPRAEAAKFYPFMPLRNVTKDYPPTLLIHGTSDTDVPYEQSVLMAAELKKHGVEHQLISIEGGEHGLDGGDRRQIDAAYESALAFVQRRLGEP
jgi:acetyl esterase/lipase